MFKPLLLLTSVSLFVLAAGSATGRIAQDPASGAAEKSFAKPGPEALAKAKKIYDVDCVICHSASGDGKNDLGMKVGDWTDPKTLSGKSDAALFKMIREGKDPMPSEVEMRARDEEVRALVYMIRHMAKSATPESASAAN